MLATHRLPSADEFLDRSSEIVGLGCKARCVDRSGRGSAKNRKWIRLGRAEQLAHRLEHADLIRRARAAPGQHESGAPAPRLRRGGVDARRRLRCAVRCSGGRVHLGSRPR